MTPAGRGSSQALPWMIDMGDNTGALPELRSAVELATRQTSRPQRDRLQQIQPPAETARSQPGLASDLTTLSAGDLERGAARA